MSPRKSSVWEARRKSRSLAISAFNSIVKHCGGDLAKVARALRKSYQTVSRWKAGGKMSPASMEWVIRVWDETQKGEKESGSPVTPEQAFEMLEGYKRRIGTWDKVSQSWGIPKRTMMRWVKVRRVLSQTHIELIERRWREVPLEDFSGKLTLPAFTE